MNKNNGKLLAAVIAMLMVVCAVAVVAAPADAAEPTAPKLDVSSAETYPIASVGDFDKVPGYDKENQVLIIDNPTILNVTAEVAIELRIVLNADLQITGTDKGSLTVTATSKTGGALGAYTVTFNDDDAVLSIDGVKVTLDTNEAKGSVFNNMWNYIPGEDGFRKLDHRQESERLRLPQRCRQRHRQSDPDR